MSLFHWTPDHVARIATTPHPRAPLIAPGAVARALPGLDMWDHWPVLEEDGGFAEIAGGLLVITLAASILPDPESRHGLARLQLLHRTAEGAWRDLGPLLPQGFSPGSREWSGCAVVDPTHRRLTLHFTAAGRRDEAVLGFEQRLFVTEARLSLVDGVPRLEGWTSPEETLRPDGIDYVVDLQGGGGVGTIKAFRDPYLFRDPATGTDYLLFAGSSARVDSPWNGVIGLGTQVEGGWRLDPPIVSAVGLNNELERPHALVHQGRTYLFWSTQAKVFAEGGPIGPTGLYGLVGESITGPWRPINGSGLVFGNPEAAPFQAYSWQVLPDLSVWGFADLIGLAAPPATVEEARAAFAGTAAPVLRLALDDDRARLID
ncbi:glycoside hydrolase family 68 protein [Sphingomonas morindae]|uniref:Glycoside hydrolase family 68 protein n=1 Tax=Sphingomonas morindae TaxID=1541170 RepID=A0ABY4X6C1_9SPHN|nr:glycoside hydrolase family 68 protein [Sphingomonas morindae]USI72447.1 glycoside hydrolase family 68 protein [Sphingomonas morindae]